MELFDYEQVEESILKYRSLSEKTETVIANLEKINKSLQNNSYWSGEASDYYKEEFANLIKNTEDLSIAMKNIPLFLEGIKANYERLDGIYK